MWKVIYFIFYQKCRVYIVVKIQPYSKVICLIACRTIKISTVSLCAMHDCYQSQCRQYYCRFFVHTRLNPYNCTKKKSMKMFHNQVTYIQHVFLILQYTIIIYIRCIVIHFWYRNQQKNLCLLSNKRMS